MKSTAAPRARSVSTTPKSRSTSVCVSAAVGSSITITRASDESAFAISTICWSAIESPRAMRSGSSLTPSCSKSSSTSRRMRRRSMRRPLRSGGAPMKTFSATVRSGKSVGSWNIMAMPAAFDWAVVSKTTSTPSMSTRPPSGRCTPARILTSVDLPAPFSPTSACASPRRSSIQPSSSARTAPKLLLAWSTTSSGASAAALLGTLSGKVEDLLEQPEALVGPLTVEAFEERRHLALPARVDVGLLHRAAGRVEVVALAHADHEAGRRDEERVVAPARLPQRGAHLRPDRGVPLAVLRDAVGLHLQLKAHSGHWGERAVWAATGAAHTRASQKLNLATFFFVNRNG